MNKLDHNKRQNKNQLERAKDLWRQGHLKQARRVLEQIVAADSTNFPALYLLGVVLCQLGRYSASLPAFRAALRINQLSTDANCALGHALQSIGRHEESLPYFDSAIGINGACADAHYNKGVALRALDRNEESIHSFDAALRINASDPDAWNNRGNAFYALRKYGEALPCYDQALAIEPRFGQALRNRGAVLQGLDRFDEALSCYDDALNLQPEDTATLHARASVLKFLKCFERAARDFERLLALDPKYPYALGSYLHTLDQCCDWARHTALRAAVVQRVSQGQRCSLPFAFLALSDSSTAQKICAQTFAADEYPPKSPALWSGERYDHRRIRLAYLSADFYEHATSFLIAGLIEHHDRSRFETIAVSLGRDRTGSGMRQRLRSAFERFIDASHMSDLDAAKLLRELQVEIVVDLGGFTTDSGTGILAWRPAPVHVNYLGYPGTLGAPYVDYIIADRFLIPAGSTPHYSEHVVRLPDCFQATDNARKIADATPSRAEMGLPDEGVVFCCFNSTYKITPPVFGAWMEILRSVPNSILWLSGEHSCVAENLRREATERGVDAHRLVFAKRVPYEEYLARYRLADLFLDTFPFNAGATASDALWTGLPVLTCAGQAFAARMAGSLLNAVGLTELVTDSLQQYKALAVRLAHSPEQIARLKAALDSSREKSALFNTDRFRQNIEKAYTVMRTRSQNGQQPISFDVGATDSVLAED